MLKDEYDKITHEIIRNIKFSLGNLENLNKIKVQTSMANGHFGLIIPDFRDLLYGNFYIIDRLIILH
jgi:hypothetical protein